MKKKSMATVEIECSNTHSIPVFSDFLSEVQKRFDISGLVNSSPDLLIRRIVINIFS